MNEEMKAVSCGCGGEVYVYGIKHNVNESSYVCECVKCGISTRPWETEAEAVREWNRAMSGSTEKSSTVDRTTKVETVEKPNVYKCSECGQYFHSTAWGSPVMYCSRCGAKLDWSGNE